MRSRRGGRRNRMANWQASNLSWCTNFTQTPVLGYGLSTFPMVGAPPTAAVAGGLQVDEVEVTNVEVFFDVLGASAATTVAIGLYVAQYQAVLTGPTLVNVANPSLASEASRNGNEWKVLKCKGIPSTLTVPVSMGFKFRGPLYIGEGTQLQVQVGNSTAVISCSISIRWKQKAAA